MRSWRVLAAVLAAIACPGQDLHFKTRTITHALDGPRVRGDAGAVHQVVQYDHSPGAAEITALLREGMEVVGALPDHAIVVAARAGVVRGADDALWIGRVDAADKLSPALSGSLGAKAITALVEFYPDVSPAEQDEAAGAVRLKLVRTAVMQGIHALVTGSPAAVTKLAEADAVAYLFPADPALLDDGAEFLTCAGMLTTNGTVGQYAAIVHGWSKDADGFAHLTYLFGSVTPKVPTLLAQAEVLRALNEWSKVTNLTFQSSLSPGGARNLLIKFVSGSHGDAYPFDGPKNALAHTFYPVPVNPETVAGDMHLDGDENWQVGGDPDIFSVVLHEVGHAIGLGHSDKPGDVMYPYYRNRAGLSANDVRTAQLLYGPPVGAAAPPANVTQIVETPAVSPLRLTVDAVPMTTKAESTGVSGTIAGGKDPVSVQWQTASGGAGRATVGSGSSVRPWNIAAIPLVVGENTVSISALDGAAQAASATLSVSRTAVTSSGSSALPVSVAVRFPSAIVTTVATATMTFSGVAVGGAGIAKVTWQTSGGSSGVATGTNSWVAAGVPLLRGTNTVVVRAWDAAGSSAWASAVVIRR